MKKLILILAFLLLAAGCEYKSNNPAAPQESLTGPDCPPGNFIAEAFVFDVTVGDGLGDVEGVDSTIGAVAWEWTLPRCRGDRSTRPTFSTVCPVDGTNLNWRLTVFDACGRQAFTSGSTPIS